MCTSDIHELSFKYCSTCKRIFELKYFYETKKTCRRCLDSSRKRAATRRERLVAMKPSWYAYEILKDLKLYRKYCTSCKTFKPHTEFQGTLKTCSKCMVKRKQRKFYSFCTRELIKGRRSVRQTVKGITSSTTNCSGGESGS